MNETTVSKEQLYREQLRKCGFRSWKKANERRYELLMENIDNQYYESEELRELQILLNLYLNWKCPKEK